MSIFGSVLIVPGAILNCAGNTGRKVYQETEVYLLKMTKIKAGLPAAKQIKEELLQTHKTAGHTG